GHPQVDDHRVRIHHPFSPLGHALREDPQWNGPGEEAGEIHEVTCLADYAASSGYRIQGPAVGWQPSGVDPVGQVNRSGSGLQEFTAANRQGGETPVETHHEASAAHLLNCSLHLGETRTIRGQWFLQEHGLAGPDGVAGQGRMLVVTSLDYYGIHRRVSQHLGWIAGAVRCAV